MIQTAAIHKSGSGFETEFIALSDPNRLTAAQIDALDEPSDAPAAGETRYYAVARRDGCIRYGEGEYEVADGCSVLYLSADGSHAVERWYRVEAGSFEGVDAVTNCDPATAEATGPAVRDGLRDALAAHHEVRR